MPELMNELFVRARLRYGLKIGREYGLFGFGFGRTYGPGPWAHACPATRQQVKVKEAMRKFMIPPLPRTPLRTLFPLSFYAALRGSCYCCWSCCLGWYG